MKAVFIKGLPDDIFLGFKTGLHNNPASCKTFDDVFQILKVFAGSDSAKPKINDLIKLRARQYNKSGPAGVFVARAVPRAPAAHASPTTRAVCFDFSKGRCTRGAECKFLHSSAPTPAAVVCTHCLKKGHLVDMCFAKYPEKRTLRPKAPSARSVPSVPRSKTATNLLLTLQESVNKLLLGNHNLILRMRKRLLVFSLSLQLLTTMTSPLYHWPLFRPQNPVPPKSCTLFLLCVIHVSHNYWQPPIKIVWVCFLHKPIFTLTQLRVSTIVVLASLSWRPRRRMVFNICRVTTACLEGIIISLFNKFVMHCPLGVRVPRGPSRSLARR